MDAQPAGSFDKKAFIEAVKAAIEAKSPKNLEQADKLKESGQTGQVKDEVKGLVGSNKEHSAEAIETATEAAPDASKAVPKPVAPLPAESAGPAAAIPAQGAAPKPAPPEQLNLEAGKHEANQELANADVTEQQLATSNEPQFTGALAAKQEAAQHAETAPGQYREQEAATLASARDRSRRQQQGRGGRHTGLEGRRAGPGDGQQVGDQVRGRGQASRGVGEGPVDLRCHRDRGEEDPRRHRPEGGEGVHGGRAGCAGAVRGVCRSQDVGIQEGPVRRLARRVPLGQGQAVRHAVGGQRVLRGRARALPQGDGPGHLERRRHRRRRPRRGEGADRQGQGRHRGIREDPGPRAQAGRGSGRPAGRGAVRQAGVRCRGQAGRRRRHAREQVRRVPPGPRRPDRGAAGREQGPGEQGRRRSQGRRRHDPQAQGHAAERAGARGGRHRQDHQGPDRLPRQLRERRQDRHRQLRHEHPRATSRRACRSGSSGHSPKAASSCPRSGTSRASSSSSCRSSG